MVRAAMFLVAAAAFAQTAPDPSDVLNRARFQIAALTRRLPKYACVETIDREYYERAHVTDCDQEAADEKRGRTKLALQVTDRVRINATLADGEEVHSWPGSTRFDPADIDQLITRGPASTGGFGGYLVDIFDNDGAQFSFLGAENEAGRQVFSYGYQVDREASHYHVRTDEGWAAAGFEGSFDIDTATLDLLRITVNALVLPRSSGLCEARSSLNYSRTRIGGGEYLLPRQDQLRLVSIGTLETRSASVFTNCREFHADPAPPPQESVAPDAKLALPAGAVLKVRLRAAIDSNVAAAGDPVALTVTEPVLDPKTGVLLLLPGAVVSGRVTRMEHWLLPERQFAIAVRWESIAKDGNSAPLAAVFPNRPALFACAGEHVRRLVRLPGRMLVQPGVIDGRLAPQLPDLREVLPLAQTDAQRCVVQEGQEFLLIVQKGAPSKSDARLKRSFF